jgi:iron(III) transport system permease protein
MKSRAFLTFLFSIFFLAPLMFLLWGGIGNLSIWTEELTFIAFRNTCITSLFGSLIALTIGLFAALLVARTDVFGSRFFESLFSLPAAVPPFIFAMGYMALFNPKAGLVNVLLGHSIFNIYGLSGISVVQGASSIPLVFLGVVASLRRLDSTLEEAARISGASRIQMLLQVTIPHCLPAAFSGALLSFLFSISAFGVPYILGISATPLTPTLTTRIYTELLLGKTGVARAEALGLGLLVFSLFIIGINSVLSKRNNFKLPPQKATKSNLIELGKWKLFGTVALALSGLLFIALPLASVALTSIEPVYGQLSNFTLKHWSLLGSQRTLWAALSSLQLSLFAAFLVTAIGLWIATMKREWLSTLSSLPYAVPGTVVALSLIVAFSFPWRATLFNSVSLTLTLGNSLWLLLIAYTLKHLAFGVRNGSDALERVDNSLPEAARIFGASPSRAFIDGVLPQLRGALVAAFTLAFLTCMTELSLSVLLIPSGRDVLGTLLFELQSYADPNGASVIACAFLLLVLASRAIFSSQRTSP